MAATVIDLAERMGAATERARLTAAAVKRHRDLTDAELALSMGMGRSKVNNYLRGVTPFSIKMQAAFAYALGVPDFVLSMEPDAAVVWVAQNAPNSDFTPPDLGNRTSGWKSDHVGRGQTSAASRRLHPAA